MIFENVPRIATRGRHLLDQIVALFRHYGYAVAETAHDCGELGNLAQSRKRFLLVARHAAKIPNFLYEPIRRPLRGVGEVIGALPVPFPGSEAWNPMHRMPALHWKTWVRLAFVEAGSDWRSLNKLAVEGGMLRDYGIAPDTGWHGGVLGVHRWAEHTGVVTGRGSPTTGAHAIADPRLEGRDGTQFHGLRVGGWDESAGAVTTQRSPGSSAQSVADPRVDGHAKSVQLGVRPWDAPAGVITGKMFVGGGPNAVGDPRIPGRPRFNSTYRIVPWGSASPAVAGPGGPAGGLAVADPRPAYGPGRHRNVFRITPWDRHAGTATGNSHVTGGALCVADPRAGAGFNGKGKYRVTGFDGPAGTVIGASTTGQGAFGVADPRPDCLRPDRAAYLTGGHYGVVPWDEASRAVPGFSKNNNGPWSVADPRMSVFATSGEGEKIDMLPAADDRLVCVIRALDGTWHRPFTTLELAALQGLVDPEEQFELDGLSDSAWRERIGNCVPPPSAKAIAGVMGRTLLLAWSGETSGIASEPIWVRPVATALMAAQEEAP